MVGLSAADLSADTLSVSYLSVDIAGSVSASIRRRSRVPCFISSHLFVAEGAIAEGAEGSATFLAVPHVIK